MHPALGFIAILLPVVLYASLLPSLRINAFVMDNATNNDTMVEALAQRCRNENIPFSSSRFRVRCMPHTVHLAAIKLLEIIGAASKDDQKKAVSRSASHPYQDMVNGIGDSPEDAELRDDEIVADGTAATVDTDQQEAARFQICVQNGEHDIAFAVQKLRRIIKHVRSSPQRRKKWEGQIRLNADELDATNWTLLLRKLSLSSFWTSKPAGPQHT
ncbi:hypothetical protein DFH08DRAFT_812883 [Mycena albidolilacea]|uniref:Uncharacterized protein n=1 Tax=Mycena albidolilacea TaxID=1033008 RepID=A0AAD7ELR3_9AGAR|nr:hypothetical protein DFH08DRAFT_812883 [Mycena albidolilacea]